MSHWVPITDLEEEIVAQQPHLNFIFGNSTDSESQICYPRPKSHLEYAAAQKKRQKELNKLTPNQNQKLKVISMVQRIAGTKPLGEQPTIDDWNNSENREHETVAMMRHFGMGPSKEEPLIENLTIATQPITEKVSIMKHGRKTRPILFDEDFFKLKPRIAQDAEKEMETESPSCSTATPRAEEVFSSSSTSFSSSNASAKILQQKESWHHNISNYCAKSSDEANSRFETANDEASFYTAPSNTSKNYVTTRSWYQGGGHTGGTNSKKFNNGRSSDGVSGSSNCTSASSSYTKQNEKRSPKQRNEEKQRPRFYTTKELYEKKRKN